MHSFAVNESSVVGKIEGTGVQEAYERDANSIPNARMTRQSDFFMKNRWGVCLA
jgi:hypothetical protein